MKSFYHRGMGATERTGNEQEQTERTEKKKERASGKGKRILTTETQRSQRKRGGTEVREAEVCWLIRNEDFGHEEFLPQRHGATERSTVE